MTMAACAIRGDRSTVGRDRSHARRRGRGRRWVGSLLTLVLVLAAAGTAYRLGWVEEWLDRTPLAAPEPPEPWESPMAVPEAVAPPAVGPAGDPAKVAQALNGPLADPDLGPRVVAQVAPLYGGPALLNAGRGPAVPASLTKLLTGAAALTALGPETTFRTRLVSDAPGSLVLVGGGDPLLAARPAKGAYPHRADLRTLAVQAAEALKAAGTTSVSLRYDDTLFTGPRLSPDWAPTFPAEDIVSPVAALWADQGREDGSRVADPALAAATRLAAHLAQQGIAVTGPPTPGTAAPTATTAVDVAVESAPVREIVQHVLETSDNDGAEVLTRHVGRAVSGRATFEGGAAATITELQELGVPTAGVTLRDGSGLSRGNLIPAATLTALLQLATQRPELGVLVAGLPVAGFNGSLVERFEGASSDAGLGVVRAKTGTLTGVHALAGTVVDRDGTPYAVVLMADRVEPTRSLAARDALDAATAALAGCHCAA